MATEINAHSASSLKLEEAHAQMRPGNHREASMLFWDASTLAIEETSASIGWSLERHLNADVMDMLAPWFPLKRISKIYDSMLLLRTNALEDYGLGDVWMGELADDIHELFTMLEFAVSQSDN